MKRIALAVGLVVMLVPTVRSTARAAIPAGYMGTPFNPAVAGGSMLPPGVKAGPYPLPGRLEFENHDMGGPNIGFFTTDHISCGAADYRTDDGAQEASLCTTSSAPYPKYTAPNGDVWYDTGVPALDGTTYPSTTTTSIYIGAVRPGDWVNITVDVQTAGAYQVGSTWASGNGPLGLEGGDGSMELQVSVNDTLALDWKDTFPDYETTANFKHWKPYPDMGTVTLEAGLQVIKLDTGADPHLNLDYVQLSLVLPDGGLDYGEDGTKPPGVTGGSDAGTATDAALASDSASSQDGSQPTGTGDDAAVVEAEGGPAGTVHAGPAGAAGGGVTPGGGDGGGAGGGGGGGGGSGCALAVAVERQPLAAMARRRPARGRPSSTRGAAAAVVESAGLAQPSRQPILEAPAPTAAAVLVTQEAASRGGHAPRPRLTPRRAAPASSQSSSGETPSFSKNRCAASLAAAVCRTTRGAPCARGPRSRPGPASSRRRRAARPARRRCRGSPRSGRAGRSSRAPRYARRRSRRSRRAPRRRAGRPRRAAAPARTTTRSPPPPGPARRSAARRRRGAGVRARPRAWRRWGDPRAWRVESWQMGT